MSKPVPSINAIGLDRLSRIYHSSCLMPMINYKQPLLMTLDILPTFKPLIII